MKLHWWLASALVFSLVHCFAASGQGKKTNVSWKKIVLDRTFRSEGVGVADVNKDGKLDVIVGDCWYEAPKDPAGEWKRHVLRAEGDRKFDLLKYSDSFCCFAGDFNGDGWPDVIVIPFPGNPCYWYENPGEKGGLWKAHLLTNSACNETPIYVDLFKTGKKVLVMGWNPQKDEKDIKKGNYDDRGEMCYFVPGKDPTQPWTRVSISGPGIDARPGAKGKQIPGTGRFSHGLGAGDVNGDGRVDIIVPQGWWEQPEKPDGSPWKFHAAKITDACADMHVLDLDGDGKADIISTSAHNYGFWWSQQKDANSFLQRPLFLPPSDVAKLPKEHGLPPDALALYQAINARRAEVKSAPWAISPVLAQAARFAVLTAEPPKALLKEYADNGGTVVHFRSGDGDLDLKSIAREAVDKLDAKYVAPNLEVGVFVTRNRNDGNKSTYVLILGTRKQFSLPSQTHALHMIDIDGDGGKNSLSSRLHFLGPGSRMWNCDDTSPR